MLKNNSKRVNVPKSGLKQRCSRKNSENVAETTDGLRIVI